MMTEAPTVTAKALRERFQLSQGYASDLVNGKRTPSLELAIRIEREMQIPPAFWVELSEAAAARRASVKAAA